MANLKPNTLQIKTGTTPPKKETLKPSELGFDKDKKKLYIGLADQEPVMVNPDFPPFPTPTDDLSDTGKGKAADAAAVGKKATALQNNINKKFDKSGGTVTGNATVSGTMTMSGRVRVNSAIYGEVDPSQKISNPVEGDIYFKLLPLNG